MSEKKHYSLIKESLFHCGWEGRNEIAKVSLPEVLSGLTTERLTNFECLQVHQKQAWYCFLVQLSAIAIARNGRKSLPQKPEEWENILLSLTGGCQSPWCLIEEDVSLPAFLQPPVPEVSLEAASYKHRVPTPDSLDMLIAKNHDIKEHRILRPHPVHWIYALVTLQTLQGFLGVGNYGIIRMNGGFGNRPLLDFTPDLTWSSSFKRDVSVLLEARATLIRRFQYNKNGAALLWLEPWMGKKESAIPIQECDPLFIEICRRIRFTTEGKNNLCCRRTNTKGTRVTASDDFHGVTGDPWVPVKISEKEPKALSLGENGWSYGLLTDILFGNNYERPPAMETEGVEGGGYMIATSVVRGQGETKGYHHRVLPMPENVIRLYRSMDGRSTLKKRSEAYVQMAAILQRNVLYPALRLLLAGGKENSGQAETEKVRKFTVPFTRDVDELFFLQLWKDINKLEEEALRDWEKVLYNTGRDRLEEAIKSCPIPSVHRYRAVSRAESVFEGAARRQLQRLFPEIMEERDEKLANRERK